MSLNYLRKVLSLRRGKLILGIQVLLFAAAMFVFIKTIPWLMAHPISKIDDDERPTPPPPEWAQSFSVNHGNFIYFSDSISSNQTKCWGYLGLNLLFILPASISIAWVMSQDDRR